MGQDRGDAGIGTGFPGQLRTALTAIPIFERSFQVLVARLFRFFLPYISRVLVVSQTDETRMPKMVRCRQIHKINLNHHRPSKRQRLALLPYVMARSHSDTEALGLD